MQKLIAFLLIVVSTTTYSQWLTQLTTSSTLSSISFVNKEVGFVTSTELPPNGRHVKKVLNYLIGGVNGSTKAEAV